MRILVSGSTGFLGTALVQSLAGQGHSVARLARPETAKKNGKDGTQTVGWDPIAQGRVRASTGPGSTWSPAKIGACKEFDSESAEGADALVHLAGASIAGGRWNASRKKLLRTSRIEATRHLMGELAKLRRPPRVIVGASAIGYYGNRGDEILTEDSPSGSDFLAGLSREWEAETARGKEFGARVVNVRFGIVLAANGGALPRMALPFKLGTGGRLGNGRQWMSWLALAEAVRIIEFAIAAPSLAGPVNAVTPNPVRNSEFTRVLAKTLHRPALFPAPAFALRLALGEMADALLLVSQRVTPARLVRAGYAFSQTDLASALADIFRN